MHVAGPARGWSALRGKHKQRGQALIYGLFVLMGGLVALFFLFNAGQLSAEKTKLVNTADAVAYSAGAMHARALNFDAYTNRAMMANEVLIAQMVSLSSWIQYTQDHYDRVPMMNCYSYYSVPVALGLAEYAPLCYALSYRVVSGPVISEANDAIQGAGKEVVAASDLAKLLLQASQIAMHDRFIDSRKAVMQEVADANYAGDGAVQVDAEPLSDYYKNFDGKEFIQLYYGPSRTRFQDATLAAANMDDFVRQRAWSSHSPWPCQLALRGDVVRTGGTGMPSLDEWRANDNATFYQQWLAPKLTNPLHCDDSATTLGNGSQSANNSSSSGSGSASSDDWNYSGLPTFYDLSDQALTYTPENSDSAKRDPRVRFAIRLTRAKTEESTSAGRSQIKPQGRFDLYQGGEAGDVLAAVATSEVFFLPPVARAARRQELASLFNPYWQVRLVTNSSNDLDAALKKQVGSGP
jgi:hypothetical protein